MFVRTKEKTRQLRVTDKQYNEIHFTSGDIELENKTYAEGETIMTSHKQRGGFVMLFSAAFPVAYVTSMAPLRFFENAGAFCVPMGSANLCRKENRSRTVRLLSIHWLISIITVYGL